MTEQSMVYDELNKAWKSTCRVLFRREIGELSDFKEYLKNPVESVKRKSAEDGSVYVSAHGYPANSKFVLFTPELMFRKYGSLELDDLKDIDSLLQAIQERVSYCGSIVLGNCSNVSHSTNVIDSNFVYNCNEISDSKYIYNSSHLRFSEYGFSSAGGGQNSYFVKLYGGGMSKRFFNVIDCSYCSDIYFSENLRASQDCMFSFNLVGKRNVIGNLVLPKEKFLSIKSGLLGQIADELEKKRKMFSIFDLVNSEKDNDIGHLAGYVSDEPDGFSKQVIEGSFSKTANLLSLKVDGSVDDYSGYLLQEVPRARGLEYVSPVSRKKGFYHAGIIGHFLDRSRVISHAESVVAGERLKLDEKNISDIRSIHANIHGISYSCPFDVAGNNHNIGSSTVVVDAVNCYNVAWAVQSNNSAYCYWPRNSNYVFGSSVVFSSSFSMKSFYSKNLTRCYEVDSSRSCADSYYLHNCENVQNGIMCFNAKNLSYAVGNTPVGKEKFARVKSLLLEWINGELEKSKSVPLSIFNLGGWKQ